MAFREVSSKVEFAALEEEINQTWEREDTFRRSIDAAARRARLRLLRRPAVRDRAAALRPSAGRHHQGHRAALLDHARLPRGAALRLGLPWPAGRVRDGEASSSSRSRRDIDVRHGQVQRSLPRHRAALHRRMAQDGAPHGPLGGLRQRLQDHGPRLHGIGLVGVQADLGQGADLRGLQGDALLPALRDTAVELRNVAGLRHVQDPAITVRFRATPESDERIGRRGTAVFLAWTTTPWTLPSNLALAVGADIELRAAALEDIEYVLAAARRKLGKDCRPTRCRDTFPGRAGRPRTNRCCRISRRMPTAAPSGAGRRLRHDRRRHRHRAHGAGFGEDDFALGREAWLPVVVSGRCRGALHGEVPDYAGSFVKEADSAIIRR